MLWNLLALTPLHIALLAVGGGLIVLLAVLGIVFSRGKKNEAETPEETVPAKEAAPEETPEETASEEVVLADTLSAARSAEEAANEQATPPIALQENAKGAAEPSVPVSAADVPSTDVPADVPAGADAQPTRVIYAEEDGWYVRVRYDKSFEAKLIQSSAQVKAWYRALKEELLSYKKVSVRRSWQHEAFRLGRGPVAKLVIRGKTLRLYLALDPAAYEGGKYLVEDASEHTKFEKTPLLYRIKNDRRCRYAKELIAEAIARAGGERGEAYLDAEDIPYEETAALIERGLVRIVEVRRRTDGAGGTDFPEDEEEDEIPEAAEAEEGAAEPPAPLPDPAAEHRVSVAAAEQLMTDDEALVLDAAARSDRYRQTIVNIDTLGQYFADGERVTIEEMRERIPFFDRKATAVKVLARGVLNKTFEVEADDFSIAAVKMILLLNGKAYRRMP